MASAGIRVKHESYSGDASVRAWTKQGEVPNGKLLVVATSELALLRRALEELARKLRPGEQEALLASALGLVNGLTIQRVNWRVARGAYASEALSNAKAVVDASVKLRTEVFPSCPRVQEFLSSVVERELKPVVEILDVGAKHAGDDADAELEYHKWCINITLDFHHNIHIPMVRSRHLDRYLSKDGPASGQLLWAIRHLMKDRKSPVYSRVAAVKKGEKNPIAVGVMLQTPDLDTFLVDVATFTRLDLAPEDLDKYEFFTVDRNSSARSFNSGDGKRIHMPALGNLLCLSPSPNKAYAFCTVKSGRYFVDDVEESGLDKELVFPVRSISVDLPKPSVKAILRRRLEARALSLGRGVRGLLHGHVVRVDLEHKCHEDLMKLLAQKSDVERDAGTPEKLDEFYRSILEDSKTLDRHEVSKLVGFLAFHGVVDSLISLANLNEGVEFSRIVLPEDGSHPPYLTIHTMLLTRLPLASAETLKRLYFVLEAARYAHENGGATVRDLQFSEVFHVLALFSSGTAYADVVYRCMKTYLQSDSHQAGLSKVWEMVYMSTPLDSSANAARDWWLQVFTEVVCAESLGFELQPGTRPNDSQRSQMLGNQGRACAALKVVEAVAKSRPSVRQGPGGSRSLPSGH